MYCIFVPHKRIMNSQLYGCMVLSDGLYKGFVFVCFCVPFCGGLLGSLCGTLSWKYMEYLAFLEACLCKLQSQDSSFQSSDWTSDRLEPQIGAICGKQCQAAEV